MSIKKPGPCQDPDSLSAVTVVLDFLEKPHDPDRVVEHGPSDLFGNPAAHGHEKIRIIPQILGQRHDAFLRQ